MTEASGIRRLLIVAHAPSPNTLALRDAVAEGAAAAEADGVTPLDAAETLAVERVRGATGARGRR